MKTNKFIYSKNPFRRINALLLMVAVLLGFVPIQESSLFGGKTVKAATTTLSNPTTESGVTTWDCVYFGNYVQSGEEAAEAEPIKWRVLSVEGDDAFLLADKNLELKFYNDIWDEITWKACTLRTWLNGEFLTTAFTANEQAAIKDTTVVNSNNPEYGTEGGDETVDKVYLLSIEEAMNTAYGFTDTVSAASTRKAENTAYAAKQNSENRSSGPWWLRSPGLHNRSAAWVNSSGGVSMTGYDVDYAASAVRPALHINLQSLSEWDYAGTVDSEGGMTEPSITVGIQTGTVTYGVVGSATYEINGENFINPAFAPTVVWNDTIPAGIGIAFNEDNTQLTLTTSAVTDAGIYRFKVTSGDTESPEATLTIDRANNNSDSSGGSINGDESQKQEEVKETKETVVSDLNYVIVNMEDAQNEELTDLIFSQEGVNKNSEYLSIVFEDNNIVKKSKIRLYAMQLPEKNPGDKVYLYFYNPKTNCLERMNKSVYTIGEDGYIDAKIPRDGNYILLTDELKGDKVLTRAQQTIVDEKGTVKIGKKTTVKVVIKEEFLPYSKVIYKVSNSRIASVNRNGVVTGKAKGMVTVKTTVTVGKSKKTFKTQITVK